MNNTSADQPTTEQPVFDPRSRTDVEKLFVAVMTNNLDFFKDLERADEKRRESGVKIQPMRAQEWE